MDINIISFLFSHFLNNQAQSSKNSELHVGKDIIWSTHQGSLTLVPSYIQLLNNVEGMY